MKVVLRSYIKRFAPMIVILGFIFILLGLFFPFLPAYKTRGTSGFFVNIYMLTFSSDLYDIKAHYILLLPFILGVLSLIFSFMTMTSIFKSEYEKASFISLFVIIFAFFAGLFYFLTFQLVQLKSTVTIYLAPYITGSSFMLSVLLYILILIHPYLYDTKNTQNEKK